MKSLRFASLALLALATSSFAFAADAGFKSIFNGKDLTGWEGLPAFWSVKDGAIVGQTTAEKPTKGNTFLVWKDGQPANFELRVSFRLTSQNDKAFGNSGIQYRSKIVDAAAFVVGGYQADIDVSGQYAGMLYEEKGRSLIMGPGEIIRLGATTMIDDPKKPGAKKSKTEVEKLAGATPPADILAVYKKGEWNDFVVIAEGNHLRHYLNGKLTADVTDTDATRGAASGVLALQLHASSSALPATALQGAIASRKPSRQGEEQAGGELRDPTGRVLPQRVGGRVLRRRLHRPLGELPGEP